MQHNLCKIRSKEGLHRVSTAVGLTAANLLGDGSGLIYGAFIFLPKNPLAYQKWEIHRSFHSFPAEPWYFEGKPLRKIDPGENFYEVSIVVIHMIIMGVSSLKTPFLMSNCGQSDPTLRSGSSHLRCRGPPLVV